MCVLINEHIRQTHLFFVCVFALKLEFTFDETVIYSIRISSCCCFLGVLNYTFRVLAVISISNNVKSSDFFRKLEDTY